MIPSARTRLFALLGDPVAHSLSPRMQNAAFRAAGLDAFYLALRCSREDLPGLLRGIARAGGGGNVTLPHKEAAARVLDSATAAVTATGACNTFWLESGRIRGDNTDIQGFARAALGVIGSLGGTRNLVLGAGGGAAAAVRALLEHGAGQVTLLARTPSRAARIAALQDPAGRVVRLAAGADSLRDQSFDLVVNATPLGLSAADPVPLDLDRIAAVRGVLDMAYRTGGTAWIRAARERGLPASDGSDMLVEQGAAAFRDWFGTDAPRRAMIDALATD